MLKGRLKAQGHCNITEEALGPFHIGLGKVCDSAATFKNSLDIPYKLNIKLLDSPEITCLGIYPREKK